MAKDICDCSNGVATEFFALSSLSLPSYTHSINNPALHMKYYMHVHFH